MGVNLSRVALPTDISQRGTGKAINREEALVYDFMPIILGERFRVDSTLSKMLLRPAPEDAPFMLKADAYETLGKKYVKNGEWTPALECYRIALDSRTSFVKIMSRIQEHALLNQNEIGHLDLSTELEKGLMKWAMESGERCEPDAYFSWAEELRSSRKNWLESNKNNFASKEYVEACLKIGEYDQALIIAKRLKDQILIEKLKQAQPKEILDVGFLKKFIDDNFPESTFGQDRY